MFWTLFTNPPERQTWEKIWKDTNRRSWGEEMLRHGSFCHRTDRRVLDNVVVNISLSPVWNSYSKGPVQSKVTASNWQMEEEATSNGSCFEPYLAKILSTGGHHYIARDEPLFSMRLTLQYRNVRDVSLVFNILELAMDGNRLLPKSIGLAWSRYAIRIS